MKRLFFILALVLFSIKLFANGNDTCNVNGTFEGSVTTPTINVPVSATFSGNVILLNEVGILGNVMGIVSGAIDGIISGSIAGNIIDPILGRITGVFTGVCRGISSDGEVVEGEVTETFSGIIICSEPCGVELDCPVGVKYPYIFCNTETREQEFRCSDDPLNDPTIPSNLLLRKAKLPIFCEFFGSSYGPRFCKDYEGIDLFSCSVASNDALAEVKLAIDKWNCVCGYTSGFGGTLISVAVSDDPKVFGDLNPKTTLAMVNDPAQSEGTGCTLKDDKATIFFNVSPEFLYGTDKYPTNPDGTLNYNAPIKKGWVNQKYKDNADLVPYNGLALFSFLQVALHEIGHILGFGHYDKEGSGASPGYTCDNFSDGVMKRTTSDIRSENITELDIFDKCMMAKLYCPDLILGIKEYQKRDCPYINVIPNPTTAEINISFEITGGTSAVSIGLYDEQGRMLKTLLSETIYSEGIHIHNSNVNLPTGMYFIFTTINNKIYTDKIIIAK